MTVFWQIVAAVLMLSGSFLVLTGGVIFFRERDAITRLNGFGPATTLGLPLITTGAFIGWVLQDGWDWFLGLRFLMALVAFITVSAVGTNVLARASYLSGAQLDPDTSPNDLADEPAPEED